MEENYFSSELINQPKAIGDVIYSYGYEIDEDGTKDLIKSYYVVINDLDNLDSNDVSAFKDYVCLVKKLYISNRNGGEFGMWVDKKFSEKSFLLASNYSDHMFEFNPDDECYDIIESFLGFTKQNRIKQISEEITNNNLIVTNKLAIDDNTGKLKTVYTLIFHGEYVENSKTVVSLKNSPNYSKKKFSDFFEKMEERLECCHDAYKHLLELKK